MNEKIYYSVKKGPDIRLQALLVIFALGMVFGLVQCKGGSSRPENENQTIERQLEKARKLNLKTPIMVDNSTRLDKVVVEERKIVFQSTLVNPEAEKKAGEEEFKVQVRKSLIKKYCATEETRIALKLGISYGHEYFSMDDEILFNVSITGEDCSKQGNWGSSKV